MRKHTSSPGSDDFQSDTNKPKKSRQTRKVEKPTRVSREEDPDFECVSQPGESDSEEDLDEEDSPAELLTKKGKKRTAKKRDEVNRLKKRKMDNIDVTKSTRDFQKGIKYKEWQLLIPHPRDINVKVQNSNDNSKDRSTINDIKRTLTTDQLEAFRRSPFGKFLDLPHCIVQDQLINLIILREVHQNRSDEVWFDFGGKLLRFGIEEFAVITGLKCVGKSKKLNIPKISSGLHDKFFDGVELRRNHIRWQFLKKAWSNDEDAVKFAKLHLLANFLMGSQEALCIDRCYIDLIDSPECDDHAWEKEVFDFTLYYMKKSIHTREQMHIYEKPEGAGYLYRCYGLILALQTWFYEVCDTAEGVICTSVGDHDMPRILKWEVRDSYSRLFLQRTFLNLPHTKFKNIVPTEEEKHTLSLDSFFKQKNDLTRNEIASSPTTQHPNNVDVIARLDSISAELEGLKQAFFEFSRRVMAEFELFREKFITSVKSPIRAFRTKSEALMKSKADKFVAVQTLPQPVSHVPVQNAPEPDVHVPSGADDDDPFPLINTQFLEEIDRTLQEKLNESSKAKAPSAHVQQNVDEERFNTGPVEPAEKSEAAKGVNRGPVQVQQEDVAEKGLNAVQDNARGNSALVVYDPKVDFVKKTTKARKKLMTDVPVKIRLQHSRPLADDFDITISGRVQTRAYDEWIAEGTLQCAPRKVANGYNYYKVKSKNLPTPFDFNVASVTDKNWFYHINETGCFLDSSHLDVLFYYLRKFGIYGNAAVRFTTTDVLFDQHIKSLYTSFLS
ncbi:Domain of unknown function (DUF1985 [Striga hermonthica]|uniref:DUF1985 domain-containing protein n=1 Tax=Striga hermonthica TaxID=68872 RepID=A0A9N7NG43_STRHE|nr:Domain of unknown function (DUF1985 [Striga hermonthica]